MDCRTGPGLARAARQGCNRLVRGAIAVFGIRFGSWRYRLGLQSAELCMVCPIWSYGSCNSQCRDGAWDQQTAGAQCCKRGRCGGSLGNSESGRFGAHANAGHPGSRKFELACTFGGLGYNTKGELARFGPRGTDQPVKRKV